MQNSDFEWFKSNLAALYKEYGNVYLAIKDKKVLGAYSSYSEGVKETSKTEELGTFIVQQCGPNESVYTNYIASFNFCN